MSVTLESKSDKYSLEEVWKFWVELGREDYETVYQAISGVVPLSYGAYDQVAFQSSEGQQKYRGLEGSVMNCHEPISEAVQVLTFSIPYDLNILDTVIETIQNAHSYQEPVIYIFKCYATRMCYQSRRDHPNRWWNK